MSEIYSNDQIHAHLETITNRVMPIIMGAVIGAEQLQSADIEQIQHSIKMDDNTAGDSRVIKWTDTPVARIFYQSDDAGFAFEWLIDAGMLGAGQSVN